VGGKCGERQVPWAECGLKCDWRVVRGEGGGGLLACSSMVADVALPPSASLTPSIGVRARLISGMLITVKRSPREFFTETCVTQHASHSTRHTAHAHVFDVCVCV
jgi:hypothetical protein